MNNRIGIGYDVHRLVLATGKNKDRILILGGVQFQHPNGLVLEGHSDADVLCHSIADALLGAGALPDIGHYFPNNDPLYSGISSLELLRKVEKILANENYIIINIDSTLIAEKPRISEFVPAMKRNISEALSIPETAVGIKATTNELLGFLGRSEGIAAISSASLALKI